MQIDISDKEQKTLWQLRNCLGNGVVPTDRLRSFLDGLEQKLSFGAAPPVPRTKKRAKKKMDRKEKYKMMRIENVHGNKRIAI
jgi:hypothetical protein